jgi:hypothetical protein
MVVLNWGSLFYAFLAVAANVKNFGSTWETP